MTHAFAIVPPAIETRTGAANRRKLAAIAAIMRRDNHRSCDATAHDHTCVALSASESAFYGSAADADLRAAFTAAVATYYAERKAGARRAA